MVKMRTGVIYILLNEMMFETQLEVYYLLQQTLGNEYN